MEKGIGLAIIMSFMLFVSACNTNEQGLNDEIINDGTIEPNNVNFSPNEIGFDPDNQLNQKNSPESPNKFNLTADPDRGQKNYQEQSNQPEHNGIRRGSNDVRNHGGAANTYEISDFQNEVVRLTNEARQQNGLPSLSPDIELTKVAQAKSEDMETNNYFSHTSPTYGSPFDMLAQFGIDYMTAAENIASGQQSAEAVVEMWLNSPGHRKNILNESVTHIGVGHAQNGNYWTQLFIKR
ncbi:CAP domain-containing protein [Aquibacillus halophilus]|uniref:CAP domain-containing protein n=1 Tax=Aquibacillus halophilus TaxID=930132 RepID=UPI0030B85976